MMLLLYSFLTKSPSLILPDLMKDHITQKLTCPYVVEKDHSLFDIVFITQSLLLFKKIFSCLFLL